MDFNLILKKTLERFPQNPYPLHSRVHRLTSFDSCSALCFVKRDDELGLAGSKIRKYRTLIPALLDHGIREVVIIGSAYSNHVLCISQLLIENRLKPTLFLKGDPSRSQQGNALFSQCLVSQRDIQWFTQAEWPHVEERAHAYAETQPHKTFVLVEGGSDVSALPGVLSLSLEIDHHEKALSESFQHLFLEAGTGLMSIAVILGHAWMQKETIIHVLVLAGQESDFRHRLRHFHHAFEKFLNCTCPFPQNFILHRPETLAAFGSTNQNLFQFIRNLAQTEGILTDPIYTGKLFMEAKKIVHQQALSGPILIHHSGGAFALAGFQSSLAAVLN